MNVDTRGLILKLNWGVCVPASCHSEDISRLFSMGPVKLPVNRVACLQKPDLEKDTSAIVAICILCVFGILVALATFSEGVMGALPVSKREEQNYFGRINNEFVSDEKFIIKNGYAPDAFELKQTASLSTGWYTTLSETNGYEKIDKSKGDIGESSSSKTDSYTRNVPAPDEHPYEKLSNGDGKSLSHNPKVSVEISNTELEAKVNDIGVKVENVADKEAVRKIHPIIKAFSLITNMPKILNGKKSKGAINCVHGIRFVSMLWIILGHTYNYGVVSQSDSQTTQNLIDADGLFKRFSFQGIMAAGFAVDTFFLLSGFLVSYLTLKDLRKRKITGGYMFMYYFHRFWRLTPLYMIVLMTFSCLYKYMGDGPLWPAAIKAADYCKTNWWTNVLYVNNLVNNHEQCLGWSWYLANDMQFYIISPIFIFTIFWYAPVGIALAVLVGAAGVSSAFYEEYVTGGDMFT
ncbi:hypothetical protein SNE40_014370 [Patella caerulea]|uniref:Acyltransferase 3 domain-containing protein n=1 Tax=Patella caerulea TaxID=87958 RepID=A0AAN8JI69_PATCE